MSSMKRTQRIREVAYFVARKLPRIVVGTIEGNAVYVHWGRGLNNFGDCLQPVLLKHYGFTPVYCQTKDADVVLVGTVLQWIPPEYPGIILGAGGADQRYCFPNARIMGVRGRLTLQNLELPQKDRITLGDPGLLLSYVYPSAMAKKWVLGIVPHFVDKNHSIIRGWQERFADRAVVIDVLRHPQQVVAAIKQCHHIISSSLHGLVVADAFGIPNVRFVIRETMPATPYYDFKYADYYSVLDRGADTIEVHGGESLDVLLACTRRTDSVQPIKEGLHRTYCRLKAILAQYGRRTAKKMASEPNCCGTN
jgi:pyruvyltransferase